MSSPMEKVSILTNLGLLLVMLQLSHASSPVATSHSALPEITNAISSFSLETLKASPKLACYHLNADPDRGVLSPYCECDGTELPQLTPTPPRYVDDLAFCCAYKTIPPCITCTSVGYPQGECIPRSGCVIQVASPTLLSSTPAASILAQEDNRSVTARLSARENRKSRSRSQTTTTAAIETPMPDLRSSSSLLTGNQCLLQDAYCSLHGSGHSLDGLRDECILWNASCSGTKSSAAKNFFGSLARTLMNNECFFNSSPECSTRNPPGRVSVFNDLRDWMRSPQCEREDSTEKEIQDQNYAAMLQEDSSLNYTCCGVCIMNADSVDVYYWHDVNANTSCQSIVGDGTSDLAVGATTDKSGNVYWGCTSWGVNQEQSGITSSNLITTAVLTTVASMTFRTYLYNPWVDSPCQTSSAVLPSGLTSKVNRVDTAQSLHPRGHSLLAPNGSVSTAVLGKFTFTSPSIYINFRGLNAGDGCGTSSISSAMFAFTAEELSTVAGPFNRFLTLSQFNPADLPCPPQSIMSQNWYKPLPGVPYRPFFAFPDKIRQEVPFFKYCNAFWFRVLDPPIVLKPALALVPNVTTKEPKAPSRTPAPSVAQDTVARKTAIVEDPAPFPAPNSQPQAPPQPSHTASSPDADPDRSESPIPKGTSPILPHPKAQQPSWSPDPVNSKPPTLADKASLFPDPLAQRPAESASSSPTSSQIADPNLSVHATPAPQHEGSPQTKTQLGPPSNEKPTTMHTWGKTDVADSTTETKTLVPNAFGNVDTSAKPIGAPDPGKTVVYNITTFLTVTAAGQLLTISDLAAASIAGTVLKPAEAGITNASTPVSRASFRNLVVGTRPPYQNSTALTIAGHTITAKPISFQIGGTSVKAGAPAVMVSKTLVGIGLSGDLVIGSRVTATSSPAMIFTVGAQGFTAHGPDLVGSGTTIQAGGPAVVIAGTSVSLDPSGVLVSGNSKTTLTALSPSSVFTVGGETFTANPTRFVTVGATLGAGGSGMTVDSTPISLNASGSSNNVTSTIPLQDPISAVVTRNGRVSTLGPSGLIAVRGIPLSRGGPGTTIDGTSMSVGSSGFVIGTSTIPSQTPTSAPVTTDGQVFTAKSNGLIAVGRDTLISGAPGTTINGTPVTMGSGGFVIGSHTIRLPTTDASTSYPTFPFKGAAQMSTDSLRLILWSGVTTLVMLWNFWR